MWIINLGTTSIVHNLLTCPFEDHTSNSITFIQGHHISLCTCFAGPPVITLHSNNTSLVVPISQSVKMLDCPYLANPPPVVQWSRSRSRSNKAFPSSNDKFTIFKNGSLRISDLAIEDSGNYMCIIVNSMGVDEATYNLLVISKFCLVNIIISF